MSTSSLHDNLNNWAQEKGFRAWGLASLANPVSLEFYRSWIEKNYHGEMQYLERHLPQKENPKLINSRIESALVFTYPYVPHPAPLAQSSLRTALYAKGEDYHFWLKAKLEEIAENLRATYPDEVFLCLTDSSPILERDLAFRAGLGWVGKNTCLLDRKGGSLFLIGEIVTSLRFEEKADTLADFCGTCTRCVEICPTGALEKPRLLNAQKCISYLTIESRKIPPQELREAIGDHFFGCDLCQTVCPWNQKVFGKSLEVKVRRDLNSEARISLQEELREILTLSGKKLEKKFFGSPLQRAGPFGLRRNAIIVAANQDLKELSAEISAWEKDEKLKELVEWAMTKLSS